MGCSFLGCNSRRNSKKFHRFPRDEDRRNKWILRCQITTTLEENARLCEDHFDESQYELNVVNGVRRLKKHAVPTLFLDPSRFCRKDDERKKEHIKTPKKRPEKKTIPVLTANTNLNPVVVLEDCRALLNHASAIHNDIKIGSVYSNSCKIPSTKKDHSQNFKVVYRNKHNLNKKAHPYASKTVAKKQHSTLARKAIRSMDTSQNHVKKNEHQKQSREDGTVGQKDAKKLKLNAHKEYGYESGGIKHYDEKTNSWKVVVKPNTQSTALMPIDSTQTLTHEIYDSDSELFDSSYTKQKKVSSMISRSEDYLKNLLNDPDLYKDISEAEENTNKKLISQAEKIFVMKDGQLYQLNDNNGAMEEYENQFEKNKVLVSKTSDISKTQTHWPFQLNDVTAEKEHENQFQKIPNDRIDSQVSEVLMMKNGQLIRLNHSSAENQFQQNADKMADSQSSRFATLGNGQLVRLISSPTVQEHNRQFQHSASEMAGFQAPKFLMLKNGQFVRYFDSPPAVQERVNQFQPEPSRIAMLANGQLIQLNNSQPSEIIPCSTATGKQNRNQIMQNANTFDSEILVLKNDQMTPLNNTDIVQQNRNQFKQNSANLFSSQPTENLRLKNDQIIPFKNATSVSQNVNQFQQNNNKKFTVLSNDQLSQLNNAKIVQQSLDNASQAFAPQNIAVYKNGQLFPIHKSVAIQENNKQLSLSQNVPLKINQLSQLHNVAVALERKSLSAESHETTPPQPFNIIWKNNQFYKVYNDSKLQKFNEIPAQNANLAPEIQKKITRPNYPIPASKTYSKAHSTESVSFMKQVISGQKGDNIHGVKRKFCPESASQLTSKEHNAAKAFIVPPSQLENQSSESSKLQVHSDRRYLKQTPHNLISEAQSVKALRITENKKAAGAFQSNTSQLASYHPKTTTRESMQCHSTAATSYAHAESQEKGQKNKEVQNLKTNLRVLATEIKALYSQNYGLKQKLAEKCEQVEIMLKNDNEELKQQKEELENQNAMMVEENDAMLMELQVIIKKNRNMSKTINELSCKLEISKTQNKSMRKMIVDLIQKLRTSKSNNASEEESTDLEKVNELERFEQEIQNFEMIDDCVNIDTEAEFEQLGNNKESLVMKNQKINLQKNEPKHIENKGSHLNSCSGSKNMDIENNFNDQDIRNKGLDEDNNSIVVEDNFEKVVEIMVLKRKIKDLNKLIESVVINKQFNDLNKIREIQEMRNEIEDIKKQNGVLQNKGNLKKAVESIESNRNYVGKIDNCERKTIEELDNTMHHIKKINEIKKKETNGMKKIKASTQGESSGLKKPHKTIVKETQSSQKTSESTAKNNDVSKKAIESKKTETDSLNNINKSAEREVNKNREKEFISLKKKKESFEALLTKADESIISQVSSLKKTTKFKVKHSHSSTETSKCKKKGSNDVKKSSSTEEKNKSLKKTSKSSVEGSTNLNKTDKSAGKECDSKKTGESEGIETKSLKKTDESTVKETNSLKKSDKSPGKESDSLKKAHKSVEKETKHSKKRDKSREKRDKHLKRKLESTDKDTDKVKKLRESITKNTDVLKETGESTNEKNKSLKKFNESTEKGTHDLEKNEKNTEEDRIDLKKINEPAEKEIVGLGKADESTEKNINDFQKAVEFKEKETQSLHKANESTKKEFNSLKKADVSAEKEIENLKELNNLLSANQSMEGNIKNLKDINGSTDETNGTQSIECMEEETSGLLSKTNNFQPRNVSMEKENKNVEETDKSVEEGTNNLLSTNELVEEESENLKEKIGSWIEEGSNDLQSANESVEKELENAMQKDGSGMKGETNDLLSTNESVEKKLGNLKEKDGSRMEEGTNDLLSTNDSVGKESENLKEKDGSWMEQETDDLLSTNESVEEDSENLKEKDGFSVGKNDLQSTNSSTEEETGSFNETQEFIEEKIIKKTNECVLGDKQCKSTTLQEHINYSEHKTNDFEGVSKDENENLIEHGDDLSFDIDCRNVLSSSGDVVDDILDSQPVSSVAPCSENIRLVEYDDDLSSDVESDIVLSCDNSVEVVDNIADLQLEVVEAIADSQLVSGEESSNENQHLIEYGGNLSSDIIVPCDNSVEEVSGAELPSNENQNVIEVFESANLNMELQDFMYFDENVGMEVEL